MTTEPHKPRRWFQFRLRTLLIVILVVSLPLSWFAVRMERARSQREAVEAIEQMGGHVEYDYMLDEDGCRLTNTQPPGPVWLRKLLGVDFFADVVSANLDCTDVTDADLKCLHGFSQLRSLNLFCTGITDAGLEHLEDLTTLERIELGGVTGITDAGLEHFGGLTELQLLFVSHDSKVTENGWRKLQIALPDLMTEL